MTVQKSAESDEEEDDDDYEDAFEAGEVKDPQQVVKPKTQGAVQGAAAVTEK